MNVKPLNHATLLCIAVMLVLLSAACGGGGAATAPVEVNLGAADIKFDPTTITTTANQPVTVNFQNTGLLAHSFVIDALGVKLEAVPAGQDSDVSFTPTVTGTYEFYCDVPGHKEAGMVGTLTVNP